MDNIIIPVTSKALVNCVIGVKTGWRHEYPGVRGITHLIEHAILLGSRKHPEPDQETFRYGLNFDGRTLPEMTLFNFTCMKRDFEPVYDILLDMVNDPLFQPDKVEREKQVNILPCALPGDETGDPYALALNWIKNLLFDWNSTESLGTSDDLRSIGIETLKKWHADHFTSHNMFALIAVDVADINFQQKGNFISSPNTEPEIQRSLWGTKEKYIVKPDFSGSEVAFGYKINEHTPALDILGVLLGNNALSKLWANGFKQHSYTNFTDILWHSTGGGFIIEFSLSEKGDFKKIREELRHVFDDFHISADELSRAVKMQSLNALKIAESGERGLLHVLHRYPLGKYQSSVELVEQYATVTRNDLYDLVASIFRRENEHLVFVGPRS